MSRDIERDILPVCRELGIGITAYGVLGRGLLIGSKAGGEGDIRKSFYPRFQDRDLSHNERLATALADVAEGEGITTAQAAIGWVASQGDDIVPLVGARTVARRREALAAPLRLSASGLAAIGGAVPEDAIQGDRIMAS